MRSVVQCVCAAAAVMAPAAAAAEPVVLGVSGDTVIVDLGARHGVGEGSHLELLHEVIVKDPVTKETLRDVFPLGVMTVQRAGDGVAEAIADEPIAKRVRVGDRVRLVSKPRSFVDPWKLRVSARRSDPVVVDTAAEPVAAADPVARRAQAERRVADAARVKAVWAATLGRPLDDRIARWRELLDASPDNLYARDIELEIASLARQAEAIAAARAVPAADRGVAIADALAELDPRAAGHAPVVAATVARARHGHDVALAFAVRDPDAAARGWLYARTVGGDGFQRLPLAQDGDDYLRGAIPAALVAAPGVEWFVEIATATGAPAPAIGSTERPQRIDVVDVSDPPAAPRGRSRVTVAVDYVDFDGGLARGFDQYTQAELDFMYRFHEPVYSFRLGFGSLAGTGGPKDVIDADENDQCRDAGGTFRCHRVNFTYGYAELEYRISPSVAVMVRPQAGRLTISRSSGTDPLECLDGPLDASCSVGRGYGLRGRVRIGDEGATNLVLGAAATTDVGTLLEAAYTWAARPEIPVVVTAQVTDMPVPEDLGVRIVGDVGWRRVPWAYPSLRVSYQARDLDHAGFSGGIACNFDW
jgi:hypothetical protein